MKRVLMLNYEFPPVGGGAGNANYYLLKELSECDDLRVDLVTSSPGEFEEVNFSDNVTIYKLDVGKKGKHFWRMSEIIKWTWRAYWFSKRLVKEYDYDLCHAWFGWPSGLIAYLLGLPYVVALRGSDVPGYNPRLKWLDMLVFKHLSRLVWGGAECVVANSEGLRELALETLDCDIKVIFNGVDVKEFQSKKGSGKRKGVLSLVSVARLIERKGFQFLIPALEGLSVELNLVGDGPMKEELVELCEEVGVGGKVCFLGRVEHSDLVEYLQSADVFVLPSLNEGMSNSILEAMSCGLPVITTNTGGSDELIKGNGLVVEKGSVESLRQAVKKFLNNPGLINRMGRKSRELAEGMSWEKMAEEYKRVYSECVE